MKFIAAISTVLLWSHPAFSTSPPDEDYLDGLSHGTDVARYLWKQGGSSCSNIRTFEDTVEDYLDEHYPLDTGNWRTDSFNAGVEAGAEEFVEKKETKCSVIEKCSDGYDCESCLSNPECTWFQDIGYCETGCGMEGCGATVCPSDLDTCESCLGGSGTPASGQYSWSPDFDSCLTDCSVVADASCYKAKSSQDPTGYDPSICEEIANTVDQCSGATDCESCLSNSECTWFADLGYCETMCGLHGCGAFVCASEINTCEECLGGTDTNASGQYSWSPWTNECVEHCMFAPADAPCFKAKSIFDSTGYDPSICDEINNTHGKSAVA